MGLFDPEKEDTIDNQAIRPCPECEADRVYVAERDWLDVSYKCDSCGYEPERDEVARGFLETFRHDANNQESDNNQDFDVPTISVCRECREQTSPEAERCPHCEFDPKEKKKGLVWWTGSGLLSMTILAPLGLAMGAKGAKEKANAKVPLTEKVPLKDFQSESKQEDSTDGYLSDLERLTELKKEGHLTEEEFSEMKSEVMNSNG